MFNRKKSALDNRPVRLTGLSSILLITLTITILSALAMSGRAWLAFGQDAVLQDTATSHGDAGSSAQEDAPSKRKKGVAVQTVRFTLYDAGIYPQEATARKGSVSIVMEDLSGGSQGLIVERQRGNSPERVTHVHREEHVGRGRETIELNPGTYQVWDASQPENRATLTIEP
jgi:hypothetical protein